MESNSGGANPRAAADEPLANAVRETPASSAEAKAKAGNTEGGSGATGGADKVDKYYVLRRERIKLVYDYTKFHVGLYATLLTAILAIFTFGFGEVQSASLFVFGVEVRVAVALLAIAALFGIAGIAGAVVASSIVYDPNWYGLFDVSGTRDFDHKWTAYRVPIWIWAKAEHWVFWLAMGVTIVGVVTAVPRYGVKEADQMLKATHTFARQVNEKAPDALPRLRTPEGAPLDSHSLASTSGVLRVGCMTRSVGSPPSGVAGKRAACVAVVVKQGEQWRVDVMDVVTE